MPVQTPTTLPKDPVPACAVAAPGDDRAHDIARLAALAEAAGFVVEWELVPLSAEQR